jgi:hypothetical protein
MKLTRLDQRRRGRYSNPLRTRLRRFPSRNDDSFNAVVFDRLLQKVEQIKMVIDIGVVGDFVVLIGDKLEA